MDEDEVEIAYVCMYGSRRIKVTLYICMCMYDD